MKLTKKQAQEFLGYIEDAADDNAALLAWVGLYVPFGAPWDDILSAVVAALEPEPGLRAGDRVVFAPRALTKGTITEITGALCFVRWDDDETPGSVAHPTATICRVEEEPR